ncbi:hypothetical protein PIB30_081426 [Stylosanthes scabra]|uniref:Uncharacterized protein n=1 Tax=Stylosanthes scabra TaxID=79078 RepID=A0ABU6USX6_9FABA|nr:hypothetical protein [Stylosanthes scabra]
MGEINPVPNVLCVHNNVEPWSQQNSSKSRVTGKNSPCLQIGGFSAAWCMCTIVCCASSSAGVRKLRAQPLGIAWAAPVLLAELLASFKAAWAALLVLVHPASNSTSNNPFFLAFHHESFAFNALFSLSKSFLNP